MTPRDKLARLAGAVPAGCVWLGLGSAAGAEIAARAGARLAVVDGEHGVTDGDALGHVMRALALGPTGALVRVGEAAAGEVKRALDAGAGGILFPQVESAEAARAAADLVLYPPEGRRGSALAVIRASGYGAEADYQARWNDRALVAVQVESRAGLSAADAIAEVAGVDMLFFGPFDYATEAGLDPAADAPVLAAAFAEIVEIARATGKLAGVFPWPGATPAGLAAAGADVVTVASDVRVLFDGIAAGVARLDG
ncbi:MAG: aldolase/citrate lyase family protein [Pseudomonadota bacterium]